MTLIVLTRMALMLWAMGSALICIRLIALAWTKGETPFSFLLAGCVMWFWPIMLITRAGRKILMATLNETNN
jgi:hypothetical protein